MEKHILEFQSQLNAKNASRIFVVSDKDNRPKTLPFCLIIDEKGLEYREKKDNKLKTIKCSFEDHEINVEGYNSIKPSNEVLLEVLKMVRKSIHNKSAFVLTERNGA
jgi:hypothetical protein